MKRLNRNTLLLVGLILTCGISQTACYRAEKPVPREERQGGKKSSKKHRGVSGPFKAGSLNSVAFEKMGSIMRSYLGISYRGASEYSAGLDCSRFTSEVFQKFDKRRIPRVSRDQARIGKSVSRRKIRFGDLVFFNIGGKNVSHVGIYVGADRFIHASESRGVVIDNLREKYWKRYYHSARRILSDKSKPKS